jgi:retinol dehydrogenase-14
MRGKTVLVTGATNGIGRATAQALAAQGAHVVVVGRDPGRTRRAAQEVAQVASSGPAEPIVADLSLMADVRRVADQFLGSHDRLDVLVDNVGALFATRQLTSEGLERTFALNHLCPYLLTRLLLPAVRRATGRVVVVSSAAHRRSRVDIGDLQSERAGVGPGGFGAYGRSKQMNVLFTYELARREQASGVTANAMHPGMVASGFGHNNGVLYSAALTLARPLLRTPEQGADTVVYLALSPDVAGVTGRYFHDRRPVRSAPPTYDTVLQAELWQASARLVGLPPD